jgi:hypothetical protein
MRLDIHCGSVVDWTKMYKKKYLGHVTQSGKGLTLEKAVDEV